MIIDVGPVEVGVEQAVLEDKCKALLLIIVPVFALVKAHEHFSIFVCIVFRIF